MRLPADLKHPSRSLIPQHGFTLVEMLVVLAIIGLLIGLVGPRVLNSLSDAKVKTARIQMENLASSLEVFYLDNGRYPSSNEGLAALVKKPSDLPNWSGPYLKNNDIPVDPWGHPYSYKAPGQNGPFDMSSTGSDGTDTTKITRVGDTKSK